jgi:hypothetical protein
MPTQLQINKTDGRLYAAFLTAKRMHDVGPVAERIAVLHLLDKIHNRRLAFARRHGPLYVTYPAV